MNKKNGTVVYPYLKSRQGVWREIVKYVKKDVGAVNTLVELGCGYCDFINNFPAKRKIGFEINTEMQAYAADDVTLFNEDAENIDKIDKDSVDFVFASNFLEHLDANIHDRLLPKINRILKPGARMILIQPNYRLCAGNYFKDPTHKTIFSDKNIVGFLESYGFNVIKLIPGILPFSMDSKLPQWPILVYIYLNLPIKPFAAQMYVVSERS